MAHGPVDLGDQIPNRVEKPTVVVGPILDGGGGVGGETIHTLVEEEIPGECQGCGALRFGRGRVLR